MDSPQYKKDLSSLKHNQQSFKPYYKWIVLNTNKLLIFGKTPIGVLNLIING